MHPIQSTFLSVALSEIINLSKDLSRGNKSEQDLVEEALGTFADAFPQFDEANVSLIFDINKASKLAQEYTVHGQIHDLEDWEEALNDEILSEELEAKKSELLTEFVHSFELAVANNSEFHNILQLNYNKKILEKTDLILEILSSLDETTDTDDITELSAYTGEVKLENYDKEFSDDLEASFITSAAYHYKPYIGPNFDFKTIERPGNRPEKSFNYYFDESYRERLDSAFERHSDELVQIAKYLLETKPAELYGAPFDEMGVMVGYAAKLKFRDVWEILSSEAIEVRAHTYLYLGIRTLYRMSPEYEYD